MAVTFFPFNSIVVDGVPDRPANAENLAAYLAGFFSNGVLMQTDTALKVEASSGMNVQIHAGMGNINGKTILADAAEIITLDTASASLARIDRVVFRLDEVNRLMEFGVLTGTPASSPVAPALTQAADVYELCLAEIRVPAGATSIIANYITDTRADADLCGVASIAPHMHDAANIISGFLSAKRLPVVPISKGGTEADNARDALINLGLGNIGHLAVAKASASNLSLAAGAMANITLNTWLERNDTNFTFSDGGIKCPYDGLVMVSGNVYMSVPTNVSAGCYVRKGETEIISQYATTTAGGISSGAMICSVKAGDVIHLSARRSTAGSMTPNHDMTKLAIMYIQ